MAIKANKKRVTITLPKKQAKWLDDFCHDHDITISHYISWMLAVKAEEMLKILKITDREYTEDELKEIMRIIQEPWINN